MSWTQLLLIAAGSVVLTSAGFIPFKRYRSPNPDVGRNVVRLFIFLMFKFMTDFLCSISSNFYRYRTRGIFTFRQVTLRDVDGSMHAIFGLVFVSQNLSGLHLPYTPLLSVQELKKGWAKELAMCGDHIAQNLYRT